MDNGLLCYLEHTKDVLLKQSEREQHNIGSWIQSLSGAIVRLVLGLSRCGDSSNYLWS